MDANSLSHKMAGLLRFGILRMVIAAADTLPRAWLEAGVRGMTLAETHVTARGRSAVAESREVLGMSKVEAAAAAVSWLSLPLMDLVDVRRIATRRESLADWTLEERNGGPVHALVDSGQSFVIAGAHFGGGIGLATLYPEVMGTFATNPPEPWSFDGEVMLRRLLKTTGMKFIEVLRPGKLQLCEVGVSETFSDMLQAIETPGSVAYLAIDAPWDKENAVYHAFAGARRRGFATGAAGLSRLAQVPVLTCVPERVGPRHCIVHWGAVHDPVARGRADLDGVVIGQLLDELQQHVGRLRHLYPHPVGWERRWNRVSERWEDPAAAVEAAAPLSVEATRERDGRARADHGYSFEACEDARFATKHHGRERERPIARAHNRRHPPPRPPRNPGDDGSSATSASLVAPLAMQNLETHPSKRRQGWQRSATPWAERR